MSTQRVYSAIDGTELKKIILRELESQMEQDTDFRQHIAYPQVRFTFRLDIEVYGEGHEQTYEKQIDHTIIKIDKETKKPWKPAPEDRPVVLKVERGKDISVPDKAREEAKIAAKIPTKDPRTQVTVDAAEPSGRGVVLRNRASEGFTG